MEKKKLPALAALFLGTLYIATALWGYYPMVPMHEYIHAGEWCFLTGLFFGTGYLVSGTRLLRGRRPLPAAFFLTATALLEIILIAYFAVGLNLDGAFLFIHLVNPLLALAYFFVFCDCREASNRHILWAMAFPLVYGGAMGVVSATLGKAPFPASMLFGLGSPVLSVAAFAAVLAVIYVLTALLFYVNRALRKAFPSGEGGSPKG